MLYPPTESVISTNVSSDLSSAATRQRKNQKGLRDNLDGVGRRISLLPRQSVNYSPSFSRGIGSVVLFLYLSKQPLYR